MKNKLLNLLHTVQTNAISFFKKNYHYFAISVLGAAAFLLIYGPYVINPTYTDWLLVGGDLSQHYVGWQGYLNGDFMFPIGVTDQLAYPNLSCVIFTDSIPIFAIFFKLFKFVLPTNFQYFGIWGLICFILIGFFSLKIINKFIKNKLAAIFASCIFLITPIMLMRMFNHTALAGQWIILMTIDFFLSIYNKNLSNKHIVTMSIVIGFLTVLIHFYFVAICGIIMLSICLYKIINDKNFYSLLTCLLPFLVSVIAVFAFVGGFVGNPVFSNSGQSEYGIYSSNLNAFFNPLDYSLILPSLAVAQPGQGEGFAYLGFGVMILLPISFTLFLFSNNIKHFMLKNKNLLISILVLCIVSSIYAISNVVTFNRFKLFTIPLPSAILSLFSIFRASGRFMWINVYLMMLASIFFISKTKFKHKSTTTIVLGMSLLLQTIDLSKGLININKKFNKTEEFKSALAEHNFWNQIGNNRDLKHIILTFPFSKTVAESKEVLAYSIADFAMTNKKTLNTFHFSRDSYNFKDTIDELIHNPRNSYVYVSYANSIFSTLTLDNNYYFYYVDNLLISTKREVDGYKPIDRNTIRFSYVFDGTNLINGTDINGIRTLNKGGISFGPYMLMDKGQYHISVLGNNLNTSFQFTSDKGKTILETENMTVTNTSIDCDIQINNLTHDCEVVVSNLGDEQITINSIVINPINFPNIF